MTVRANVGRYGYDQAEDPVKITISIPTPLSGQPAEELAARARLLLLTDEVRAGRLTRAAAAQALDMTLDAFLAEAGRHGLYAIDYDIEDLKRELDTIAAPTSSTSPGFELVTFGAGGRFSAHDVDTTSALDEADDIERSRF